MSHSEADAAPHRDTCSQPVAEENFWKVLNDLPSVSSMTTQPQLWDFSSCYRKGL